jgi:RNA polymerase sigma-70 factor (ECF subfamily)
VPTLLSVEIQQFSKKSVKGLPLNPGVNESTLVQRAKANPEAFGELYQLYVDRIYNYVYYRTGNSHDAEDLTARIFIRAMQHIAKYEDRGLPFSAWLYRIARNLVANWHRDEGRRKAISLDDISQWRVAEGSLELGMERLDNKELLLTAVRRLPDERQELLILKFVDRLSNAEIGEVLGRSEGAIKSLYHRTLLTLRDELDQANHKPRTS